MTTNGIIPLVVTLSVVEGSQERSKKMKKDDKSTLILLGVLLFIAFPGLFVLGVIVYALYIANKNKSVKEKYTQTFNKYETHKKTKEENIIDTTAEVVDSKVLSQEEWTATKEYKR